MIAYGMIRDNLARLKRQIAEICWRLGRDPEDLVIIGVSKYADAARLQEAVEAGTNHIGENRVQDAQRKFASLSALPHRPVKHLIGHLQTNKVRQALEIFDVIQSVDSLRLAEEIQRQAARMEKMAEVLVQVNISGETQKFGIPPGETLSLLRAIAALDHVRVRGLMGIGPLTDREAAVRGAFRLLRQLRDEAADAFAGEDRIEMKYLSMGMSDDFAAAIEEGSNMVRIGRAIFGDTR